MLDEYYELYAKGKGSDKEEKLASGYLFRAKGGVCIGGECGSTYVSPSPVWFYRVDETGRPKYGDVTLVFKKAHVKS